MYHKPNWVLLAPDSQSLEAALLVLDQVARKWAMSVNVNYDKTIGVVVTPPTAATQGHLPSPPPGSRWIPTGPFHVPGQHHAPGRGLPYGSGLGLSRCLGPGECLHSFIMQGNGGQDQEIQSRINAASQVFRSLKKSVFTSNHVDLNSKLHLYSCLVLSRLTYGAAVSWALTGSQAAQLETSTTPACAA